MPSAPAQSGAGVASSEQHAMKSVGSSLSRQLTDLRAHLGSMAAAVPRVHGEIAGAVRRVQQDRSETGGIGALLLVLGFLVVGFAAEWVFRRVVWSVQQRSESGVAAPPRERLVRLFARFVLGLGALAVFALASIGFFLAFRLARNDEECGSDLPGRRTDNQICIETV